MVKHRLRYGGPRDLEHRLGHVDPDHLRTALDCVSGEHAGPAADVEQPGAGADVHRVEQRVDGAAAQLGEAVLVTAGPALPARPLELVERVRVELGRHGRLVSE
jgi:hypothetical protein